MVDIVLGIVGTAGQAPALASGAGSALVATGAGGSGTGVLVGQIGAGMPTSPGLGGAGTIGALSVPPNWTTAAPSAPPVSAMSGFTLAAEPISTAMPPAMWSALPMAQLAGRGATPRSATTQRDTRQTKRVQEWKGQGPWVV
jgi:PPE-SVP subfamily C-terminal region